MQKDTKRETPRERRFLKIMDQESHSLCKRVSSQINRILMGEDDLPECMIHWPYSALLERLAER